MTRRETGLARSLVGGFEDFGEMIPDLTRILSFISESRWWLWLVATTFRAGDHVALGFYQYPERKTGVTEYKFLPRQSKFRPAAYIYFAIKQVLSE